jgi:hypothetical protein
MNTRVWDKVGLELVQVDIQGTVETERSSNARNDYLIEQLAGQKKGRYLKGYIPCAINLLRFSVLGLSISKLRRQIS